LELLLPFFYLLIFILIIRKIPFFHDADLPRNFFIVVFIVKSLLGILYTRSFSGDDTYMYYDDARLFIYPTLFQNPLQFLYLTFAPNATAIPDFIRPHVMAMGYWGDTSDYMVVRFNAVACLFSFGNFYVHPVFMAFVSLMGLVWLHRAYIFAAGGFSRAVAAAIFLIPSVLFWGSGVHKEGLLLFTLGLLLYGCVRLAENLAVKNILFTITGAVLTYFIRDYVLFMLLPGMLAFFLTSRNYIRIRFLPLIYVLIIAAGILMPVFDGMNFAEAIAWKQQDFKTLEAGGTQISVKNFHPTAISLLNNLPQALRNSLLGPFMISAGNPLYLIIMFENALLFLAAFLFPWITGRPRLQPFALMCLLFSFSLLILIGYIVPNVGAIVRYRSIALPFLFIFLYSGKKR